jgi:hypothetical protein
MKMSTNQNRLGDPQNESWDPATPDGTQLQKKEWGPLSADYAAANGTHSVPANGTHVVVNRLGDPLRLTSSLLVEHGLTHSIWTLGEE